MKLDDSTRVDPLKHYKEVRITKWGEVIPEWVIYHNNHEFAKRLQAAYHDFMLNVENCRLLGIKPIPYNLSKIKVWCDLDGYREGAD